MRESSGFDVDGAYNSECPNCHNLSLELGDTRCPVCGYRVAGIDPVWLWLLGLAVAGALVGLLLWVI